VLQALAAMERAERSAGAERWQTAEVIRQYLSRPPRGTPPRTTQSVSQSCRTATVHCWAERRRLPKTVMYRITGAGRAELRRAGITQPDPPPRPSWVDHDGLCQYRQSAGRTRCTCSPACRCRACVREENLAWLLTELALVVHGGDVDAAEAELRQIMERPAA
jgi:hypothetical protein